MALLTLQPVAAIIQALRDFYQNPKEGLFLVHAISSNPSSHQGYSVREELVFCHSKLVVPETSTLRSLLLQEFHASPTGGHAGIQQTYARLSALFYWPLMGQSMVSFIKVCLSCQAVKPITKAPQGSL
ncbi:hypothetical protein Scep_009529 [Stephania cephalantha]|uniref:Integrase zinc-binding domain-containing protein n=1 Tax=Stephania cephalantha TaxID=152367 RepID=A0AAP0JUT2_9MAGN